ncbi:MAG: hypothetical protein DRP16_06310 [Candidatus Aenigmatarchaeota archaeon]|nr:MAG: hypothetical protein DRP16_06310 [Candidatus Aenigmarchaeota archaeon]
MFTIILLAIIIICLILIGLTVGRKFPLLANINIHELQAEKQAEVKAALLEKRFKRRFGFVINFFHSPAWQKFFSFIKKAYQKTVDLEKKYKEEQRAKKMARLSQFEREERIKEKLTDAEDLIKQENYSEAEKTYIEIVALDPLNIPAYLGLAKIYLKQKDFEHAKELYEHILKINSQSDRAFSGLGDIAAQQGNWEQAKNNYQKSIELAKKNPEYYLDLAAAYYKLDKPGRALTAVRRASELEPNNPKYLDFLIEAAIINKNKILALDAFNKLKNINPDNQKLAEFRKRIQEL